MTFLVDIQAEKAQINFDLGLKGFYLNILGNWVFCINLIFWTYINFWAGHLDWD